MISYIYQKNLENFRFIENIKVDRIQHYMHTKRPDYAMVTLQKFIADTKKGILQRGWSNNGRLENY